LTDLGGYNSIGFSLFNTDGTADGTESNLVIRLSDTGAMDMFDVLNGVVQQPSQDRPSASRSAPNGTEVGLRVEYDGTYVVFSVWDGAFTTKSAEITSADFAGGNFTSTPSAKCGLHWGGTATGATNYFTDCKVYTPPVEVEPTILRVWGNVSSNGDQIVVESPVSNAVPSIAGLTAIQIRSDFGLGFLFNSQANRDAFVAEYSRRTFRVNLDGDTGVTSPGWTFDTNVSNTRAYVRIPDWSSFPGPFPYSIGAPYSITLR